MVNIRKGVIIFMSNSNIVLKDVESYQKDSVYDVQNAFATRQKGKLRMCFYVYALNGIAMICKLLIDIRDNQYIR